MFCCSTTEEDRRARTKALPSAIGPHALLANHLGAAAAMGPHPDADAKTFAVSAFGRFQQYMEFLSVRIIGYCYSIDSQHCCPVGNMANNMKGVE